MSYINFDLDSLKTAKKALSEYVSERNRIVGQLNDKATEVSNGWCGDDYTAFRNNWRGMSSSDGVFTVAGESVKNYYDLLETIYSIYNKAQSESVEQCSKIGACVDWVVIG